MNNATRITTKTTNKNNVIAKVQKGNTTMKQTTSTTKNVIVNAKLADLLELITYSEKGVAKKGNAFGDGENHFYTVEKAVGFMGKNDDGKEHFVKLADNPLARVASFVAKKWAVTRDWLPEYKYKSCKEDWDLEDVQSYVTLNILNELKNGVDRKFIIGDCFDFLDLVYGVARKTGGNAYANQDALDILEYARPCEYRRKVLPEKYPKEIEEMDENFITLVNMLFMGNFEEIELLPLDYWSEEEVEQFKIVAEIFRKAHESHKFAKEETWRCAECFTLGVPRKDAITRIYGENLGRKKYRSCEVLYSKHVNEVQEWLLEGIANAKADGIQGLEKWEDVLERARMIEKADDILAYILEHNWMEMDKEQVYFTHRKIVANPAQMIELLQAVVDKNGGDSEEALAPTVFATTVEEVASEEVDEGNFTELTSEEAWLDFLANV